MRPLIEELYAKRSLRICAIDAAAAMRSLQYVEIDNLKAADALHVSIMKELGETVIVSADKDFDGIAGITRIAL